MLGDSTHQQLLLVKWEAKLPSPAWLDELKELTSLYNYLHNVTYTARPKKSHHLELMKQIVKSLPLDNYCMDDYVSAVN